MAKRLRKYAFSWTKGDTCLTRWVLLDTKLLNVYLHKFTYPNLPTNFHDHPYKWQFSIILRGGYTELIIGRTAKRRRIGSITVLRPLERHIVAVLHRKPTWTLLIRGPRV